MFLFVFIILDSQLPGRYYLVYLTSSTSSSVSNTPLNYLTKIIFHLNQFYKNRLSPWSVTMISCCYYFNILPIIIRSIYASILLLINIFRKVRFILGLVYFFRLWQAMQSIRSCSISHYKQTITFKNKWNRLLSLLMLGRKFSFRSKSQCSNGSNLS